MRDTRRLIAVLVAGMLASGLGAVWLQKSQPAQARTDDPSLHALAVAQLPTTTIAAAPPTTVAAPARATSASRPARPVRVPREPYAPEPIVQIGTIEIPKIGLVHPIFHGITLRSIDRGPSHWPGTAFPGENGNAVFAGHRVTHTHPFLHIDQLVEGDQVIFTVNGKRSAYVVTGHEVVTPKDLRIVEQTSTPTATIFGCHPPHSAKYRYVVHLALVQE